MLLWLWKTLQWGNRERREKMRDLKNIVIIALIFLLPLVILSFLGVDLEANGDTKKLTEVIQEWGQKPFLSPVFSQTTESFIDEYVGDKVFCPVCQEKGMSSVVYVGGTLGTLMYSQPYYDEEGIYHYDDPNTYTTSYSCSKGHEWSISRSGNIDKEWLSIQKNTEDEPVEYTKLEEGKLSLHDNSEIIWNESNIDYVPATAVIFGDNVGKISWDEGTMKFEGDAFESARIFFEVILKPMIDDYIENKQNEGVSIIEDEELEEGSVSLAFGELEQEHILFQYTTTGQLSKTFKPEWFMKIVDTDLSKCFVDNRLRIEINGETYWIQVRPDDWKPSIW